MFSSVTRHKIQVKVIKWVGLEIKFIYKSSYWRFLMAFRSHGTETTHISFDQRVVLSTVPIYKQSVTKVR